MANIAFTGINGSGKSYLAMERILLPALEPKLRVSEKGETLDPYDEKNWIPGRRVVASIEGLQVKETRLYVAEKLGCPLSVVGEIIRVDYDDTLKPGFYPHELRDAVDNEGEVIKDPDGFPIRICDDLDTVIKAGDLIIIDEAHRLKDLGKTLPRDFRIFIREHRHYVNQTTGVSSDIIYLTQSVMDLPPFLKDVLHNTYVSKKQANLGFSKNYKLELYAGKNLRVEPQQVWYGKYLPEIYNLYKSHNTITVGANEKNVDRKSTIWSSKLLWIALIGGSVGAIVLFYMAISVVPSWLSTKETAGTISEQTSKPTTHTSQAPTGATPATTAGQPSAAIPQQGAQQWIIVGHLSIGTTETVMLMNAQGELTRQPGRFFVWEMGKPVSGKIGNILVTRFWSGPPPSAAPSRPFSPPPSSAPAQPLLP